MPHTTLLRYAKGQKEALRMEFRVLGPLEVHERGRPLELRSRKQRALLAILLLHANEWLSADALIEALWGEDSPHTAQFALHNYVAQLRRALGHELIVSHAGGYALEIAPEQLDLRRFERLLEDSRACEGRDRLERLQEALALWRGPALADLVYESFAAEEARRLEELRTDALEELVDAELALGEGPELVERLEALVAEHPYRERLRGQLMLALYRGGRQAEALECYRQTRKTLVEELGIEPGSALREFEQAILRHDPSLEPPAAKKLPPLAERRKIVTVLFAELRFAETLDPEVRHQASLGALSRMRTVLESHGAAIEQRESEELLAVFGLPQAHEDDAPRAARAALELQAELDGVELRLALESGEVLAGADEAGHGFVTGAVVPAARHLLERARAGDVLVGPLALALLGEGAVVHPGAGTGARLLRLAEPVQVDAPLAGRRDELAALHTAFSEVAGAGQTRLFVLLGEAGVGKTRLAAELTSELEGQATVVQGRCLSYGQALSYWPLVEILRLLGQPAQDALKLLLSGGATSPGQLAWSVRQALAKAASARPLLVLFEDLHWAEPALLDLLEAVSRPPDEAPALLLCLARPELLEQHPDWVEKESLLLAPLPRVDAEALLDALPEGPEPKKRETILARGGGNPLFLEELSAFLAEDGGDGELPPRLQVLLQARLEQLPEPQRLMLATAALEGTVFYRGALQALIPDELAGGLAALTKTALIRPVPAELEGEECYRFRHDLIREAAYSTLPKSERARLHASFADWLAGHAGDRSELEDIVAYHLEQGALTERELWAADPALEARAAEALTAAAGRASRRPDIRAAIDFWRRALALLDERDPRASVLELELALAISSSVGAFEEAMRLLERAEQRATDPAIAAAVRVARLAAGFYHDPEHVSGALRCECEEAIPLFEQRGDHLWLARAWFALALANWFELRIEATSKAFEESAVQAGLAGDHVAEMLTLDELSFFRAATTTSYAAEVREGEQLVARFPGEPFLVHCLGAMRSLEAFDRGRFPEGRSLARQALDGYRQAGYSVIAAAIDGQVAALELFGGHIAEAERIALAGIRELEEQGEHTYIAHHQVVLAQVRIEQGRYREALELSTGLPGHYARILGAAGRARAHLGLGELDQAEAAAGEAVALAEETDSLAHQAEAQCALAEVLAAGGRFPEALAAAEEAARLWRSLDRELRGAYAAGLIAKIERELTVSDVPAASL
jgi:DNA-binding SARP family transcriptional activator